MHTMKNLYLTTKIESRPKYPEDIIPAGTKGKVIDIMIEDSNAMFLLEFKNTIEWYRSDEVEDCDYSTENT